MHTQLHIFVESNYVQDICSLLELMDALSITFQDAAHEDIYEIELAKHTLWKKTKISVLFDEKTDVDEVQKILKHSLSSDVFMQFEAEKVQEKIWEREWMQYFKPMSFGKKLHIYPHGQFPKDNSEIVVFLDPGLAFGTGTHPTTRLCLEWLDAAAPLDKQIIMDYGCGSGILSLAALKLGATIVWGIDHDPQALTASRENAERNHISSENFKVIYPEEIPNTVQVDMLLANILAKPLIELAPIFPRYLKKGGKIVLSGILVEHAQEVEAVYSQWFKILAKKELDNWVLIEAIIL